MAIKIISDFQKRKYKKFLQLFPRLLRLIDTAGKKGRTWISCKYRKKGW